MPTYKNYGFSQLTILVVLLAISFLALIATSWQLHNNQKIKNNFNQKIATLLANEITNRMYLNQDELFKRENNFYVNFKMHLIKQYSNTLCYNYVDGCNSLTTAANDLLYWQQAINDNLPNGAGKIFYSDLKNNTITIEITWGFNNKKLQRYTTNIFI